MPRSEQINTNQKVKIWLETFKQKKRNKSKIEAQKNKAICYFLFEHHSWKDACHKAGLDEEWILNMSRGPSKQKGWYSSLRSEWCKAKAKAWLVHQCNKPYSAKDIEDASSAFQLESLSLRKYIKQQQSRSRRMQVFLHQLILENCPVYMVVCV